MKYLQIIAAGIVLFRCLCIAAHLDHQHWNSKLHFGLLALGFSLMAGGAGAVGLGMEIGTPLLIVGVALQVLFDRRRPR